LISTALLLLNDLLSLKTDVNVPIVSNKQKSFLLASLKPLKKKPGSVSSLTVVVPDPDAAPYQKVTDPKHWLFIVISYCAKDFMADA
jgi:hypothetical protein